MADDGERKITQAIIQPVDLEYGATLFVDYFADPRFADTVLVTDEVTLQVIYNLALDDSVVMSDAFTTSRVLALDLADVVVMSDAFDRTATFSLSVADGVVMADNVSAVMAGITNLNFDDIVVVVDAGVLQHYDYASVDYMLTPVDYVSAQRTF
ncbi:MAG TPA: hypothetical protein VMT27_02710 [Actinomycetes bacterium]|nr:hypothetical protein [Actinomycetes bacterium]